MRSGTRTTKGVWTRLRGSGTPYTAPGNGGRSPTGAGAFWGSSTAARPYKRRGRRRIHRTTRPASATGRGSTSAKRGWATGLALNSPTGGLRESLGGSGTRNKGLGTRQRAMAIPGSGGPNSGGGGRWTTARACPRGFESGTTSGRSGTGATGGGSGGSGGWTGYGYGRLFSTRPSTRATGPGGPRFNGTTHATTRSHRSHGSATGRRSWTSRTPSRFGPCTRTCSGGTRGGGSTSGGRSDGGGTRSGRTSRNTRSNKACTTRRSTPATWPTSRGGVRTRLATRSGCGWSAGRESMGSVLRGSLRSAVTTRRGGRSRTTRSWTLHGHQLEKRRHPPGRPREARLVELKRMPWVAQEVLQS